MHLRQDALAVAAAWIGFVERYARSASGLVATVGTIRVSPGAANVVPGSAVATVDVRHGSDAARETALGALVAEAERAGAGRGVTVRARELSRQAAVAMDARVVEAIAGAVEAAGIPVHRMVSGAGHDAMILAAKVPSGMLFVRTPGGLSHHPEETVLAADVQAAVDAMMRVLKRLESEWTRTA